MEKLLEVQGLSKQFGSSAKALQDVSFKLGEGRCTALLGPNGAGKTTTIRILTGLLKPSSGSIRFRDVQQVARAGAGAGAGMGAGGDHRALIGYLPQTPAFHGWMSGLEFAQYAAELCGMGRREAAQRSVELLERVGIGAAGKRRIAGYSGGMKQRLGLAQALIHRPKLLILDEPVSALDPIGRREVMELLGELKREMTILFSTHVLHDAEELCDDVLIMESGRIALQGALSEIRAANRESVLLLEIENENVNENENENENAGQPAAREAFVQWLQSLVAPSVSPARSTAPAVTAANSCIIRYELDPLNSCAAKLIVRDIGEARRIVLEQLLARNLPVTKLEIGYSTLEDLFLKVVKHK
ncbi:ABC-2 type transport system ATP-binding protein [Paenibacillus taihuensis]|uniref:ABC-2 type transport system ATP-binding protein n=1 Tax=Paenibacillus taihuensis TaxID=1156355 RepID=A0A3D9RZ99_9BACL|nr:ABC transporter ATP-binding protein [Paenibacillus taihuensis]REE85395.1 ABC-2 type transport system ATP-binding protein [Paenibacillus taihuensis]